MEANNLPVTQFKTVVIKMLKELKEEWMNSERKQIVSITENTETIF